MLLRNYMPVKSLDNGCVMATEYGEIVNGMCL